MNSDRWEFYLDARGLWCWRRVHTTHGILSDSKRCFPTRNDCIADAVKHGYVVKRRAHRKGVKWAKTTGSAAGTSPPARRRTRAGGGACGG